MDQNWCKGRNMFWQ